ncbi:YgfZ/GcvT domain-containing protein [Limoniibacter endophyticus]|uniref:Aminomethyltransferase n=1 Tax=Limoniibacter endophyticus TaxID=1565040 RepID=A0A8J3DR93_9HYPH|nr:folate-binding protein YgfZ [Limoniibacter endophyticus]GHC68971.1 aminomethyltransferase [Limoniibacter endophyticus]
MIEVALSDRSLIDVTGEDAETLLQSIVTLDLDSLKAGELRASALLTPQGKILFDFLISRQENGFLIDCRADIADDLVKRLTLYKLRARVMISKREQVFAAACWDDESGASRPDSTGLRDLRFGETAVYRRYDDSLKATGDIAYWTDLRIAHAVPESGSDYALSDAFPHDILFDQSGGVGLRKGCYIGQEVVSRMHHRGTARRRLLIVESTKDLPPTETPVTTFGKPIGTLGTVSGSKGLAILRIDKVKTAMDAGEPLVADGVALNARIPDWAGFTFPESSGSGDE